jgi:hypothetical protein
MIVLESVQSNGKPFSLLHKQMPHSFIRESASKKVAHGKLALVSISVLV